MAGLWVREEDQRARRNSAEERKGVCVGTGMRGDRSWSEVAHRAMVLRLVTSTGFLTG